MTQQKVKVVRAMGNRKQFRRAAIAAAATIGIGALTGCGVSPAPDEEAIRYNQPPFSGVSFAECVPAGSFNAAAPWSGAEYYRYPAGQRTYSFSGDGSQSDAPAFKANTKDGVEMTVSGVVAFKLATDCENLRSFHENIGIKTNAYVNESGDGWKSMLDTYLGASIQRAVNDATQGRDWKGLYSDPTVKAEWERQVQSLLPKYVTQAMQGSYFEAFSPTIQKPDIPTDLTNALQATQVAVEQNTAQTERNKQVDTELESIRKLVDVLGPDGYNTYQAIKDGRIEVVAIPQGSNVNVTPKESKQ